MTSTSKRMVTGFLTGRYICPRTALLNCSSLSSGISDVSICSSGMAAIAASSLRRCLSVNFFIKCSLTRGRFSGGDDSNDLLVPLLHHCVNNNQYFEKIFYAAEGPKPLFTLNNPILVCKAERIVEDFHRNLRRNAVLFAVFSILVLIPLESHDVFWRYLTLPPI